MYNKATFLIGFVNVRIFYIINKIRVKNLGTALNLLWDKEFVGGNNFEILFFK